MNALSLATVGPKRLTEKIYDLLKRDIIECQLEPGELLRESVVTQRYQIGHTPFREACHRLEAEGLIQILPHRGYLVASFSQKDIRDLFELRMAIEPFAAELAAERGNPDELKGLEENLGRETRLVKTRPSNLIQSINWNNMRFHLNVAQLADNRELFNSVENIHQKLMRTIMFTAKRAPNSQLLSTYHRDIVEAIKGRRAGVARKCMAKDIQSAQRWIRDCAG
jgi:GntR family transcriptional regulator, rspAB operon transcriptional repressor